jgi:hypothetical protein
MRTLAGPVITHWTLYQFVRRSDGSPIKIDLFFWPAVNLWKVTVLRCDREVTSLDGFITRAQAMQFADDWRNFIEHDPSGITDEPQPSVSAAMTLDQDSSVARVNSDG